MEKSVCIANVVKELFERADREGYGDGQLLIDWKRQILSRESEIEACYPSEELSCLNVCTTLSASKIGLVGYRWASRSAVADTPTISSPKNGGTGGTDGTRRLFWNEWPAINWASCRGALIYIHGISECFLFSLMRPDVLDMVPDYSTRKTVSDSILRSVDAHCQHKQVKEIFQGSWAHSLTQMGYVVYGLDMPGHGLSQRWNFSSCNIERFEHVCDDVIEFVNSLWRYGEFTDVNGGKTRLFMGGTSMGGCALTRIAQLAFSSNRFQVLPLQTVSKTTDTVSPHTSLETPGVKTVPHEFDSGLTHIDSVSKKTDGVSSEIDNVSPHTDTVSPHTDTVSPHTDTVSPHTDTVSPHTDTVSPHTDTVSPHTETVQLNSDALKPHIPIVSPPSDTVSPHISPMVPIISGIILFCPAISADRLKRKFPNRFLLPIMNLLSTYLPTYKVASLDTNTPFPFLMTLVQKDPLVYSEKIPCRMASEVVQEMDKIGEEVSALPTDLPVLLIQSKYDTMTDPEGSAKLIDDLKCKDKQAVFLDYSWHFLTKEPGYENTAQVAISWLNERS